MEGHPKIRKRTSALPLSDVCDDRDLCLFLAHLLLAYPEFSWFFESRLTTTRSRMQFLAPVSRNNTVNNSFRWRLSRRLTLCQYQLPQPSLT